jgi:hypothetical protein
VITADTVEQLERLKWYLWHGNVFRALQIVDDLQMDVEAIEVSGEQRKLLKALREFQQYFMANKPFIPNYGDRFRNGETISIAFVESTVNQVVSKRFVKKGSAHETEKIVRSAPRSPRFVLSRGRPKVREATTRCHISNY